MTTPSSGLFRASDTKRHNTTVQNPSSPETNQLAIYKCSWEVEPGTTRKKFSKWSERVLNPGSPDLKARALTTGPQYLKILSGELGAVQVTIFVKHYCHLPNHPKNLQPFFAEWTLLETDHSSHLASSYGKFFHRCCWLFQLKCDKEIRLTARKHSKNLYLKKKRHHKSSCWFYSKYSVWCGINLAQPAIRIFPLCILLLDLSNVISCLFPDSDYELYIIHQAYSLF